MDHVQALVFQDQAQWFDTLFDYLATHCPSVKLDDLFIIEDFVSRGAWGALNSFLATLSLEPQHIAMIQAMYFRGLDFYVATAVS